MKGLIIKDLLNLRRQGGIILLLIILYMAMGFLGGNIAMVAGMMMILAGMLPLTALSYDERAKWDKYALTMPVTRREMVTSKYVLGMILVGCAFVISLLAALAVRSLSLQEGLITLAFLFIISTVFISILLPAGFKLGVEKSRYLMMIVLMVPVLVIITFANINPVGFGIRITEQSLTTGAGIGVPLAIIFYAISYLVSVRVYENKEF